VNEVFHATVTREDGGFTITFDGLNGVSFAESEADVPQRAHDLLASIFAMHIGEDDDLPRPSGGGDLPVRLDALTVAKIGLRLAMREERTSGRALAARLGIAETALRRLLDLDHQSHIRQVEAALAALGRTLVADISEAA